MTPAAQTFSSAPTSVSYLWYRCESDLSGTINDDAPTASGSNCVSTGVTRNSYTLSALDLLRPYVVAMVTRDGGDSHYSDAFVMKRKPSVSVFVLSRELLT